MEGTMVDVKGLRELTNRERIDPGPMLYQWCKLFDALARKP
jgi:hypothetical protein